MTEESKKQGGTSFQPVKGSRSSNHGQDARATPPNHRQDPRATPPNHGQDPRATPPNHRQDPRATPPNHGQDARATPQDHGQDPRATPPNHRQDPRATPPNHGQDARATSHIRKRHGAYLPHWTCEYDAYSVTFRLADSLPAKVIARLKKERESLARRATARGKIRPEDARRLDYLFSERLEAYLDAGQGERHLAKTVIARMMRDALEHFDGRRYRLIAWAIMPNHVHVVVQPLPGYDLPTITHSWKSFTAKQANRMLGRTGPFWQPESYDHLIRDEIRT